MSHDLSPILNEWPYDPGRINARIIKGNDGQDKLQMRIDLGVLQMNLTGRPDGQRPHGFDSLLDYQLDRLHRYIEETGSPAGFVLSEAECAALREEAVHYYHRYVGLFAVRDFPSVIRDTQRNLQVIDLCRDFGSTESDQHMLEQFRPQIIMMRVRSEAEIALAREAPRDALAVLDLGLKELRSVFQDAGAESLYEQSNEVQLLRGMRDVLVPKLPSSQRAELQERLMAALDAENYELAAILRDELRLL
jgi:hypothetical protein